MKKLAVPHLMHVRCRRLPLHNPHFFARRLHPCSAAGAATCVQQVLCPHARFANSTCER